jgi:hypothetical protein
MSMKARHHLIVMSILILLIIGVSAVGVYFLVVNPPVIKQTVLVINPGGTGQTQIAQTWIDGNVTTDSGVSGLKSATQIVYLPQSPIATNQTINNQGQLAYSVKVITYSFPDVAKFFGVQTEALIYKYKRRPRKYSRRSRMALRFSRLTGHLTLSPASLFKHKAKFKCQ